MTKTGQTRKCSSWRIRRASRSFARLVRRTRAGKPQYITLHGRKTVVVIAWEEYQRLKDERTGKVLVDALANSPLKEVDLDSNRIEGPVREVDL